MGWVKNFLKKHFLILKVRDRLAPAVQLSQRQLFHLYREKGNSASPPPLDETGFRVFSQFEEDGLLLYIFSVLGMGSKTFVEIGSDDGINSNCANLAFHFGWTGLFIDGNSTSIDRGRRFYRKYPHPWMHQPQFLHAYVTPDNVNALIAAHDLRGDIELLSIDIDGDDYWIWNALEVISPKVVVIETHIRFGMHDIVVPYGRAGSPGFKTHHGASPSAMVKLARKKGYRLIGANQLGFNFIFLRDDIQHAAFPEVEIASVLQHPAAQKSMRDFVPRPEDGPAAG